MMTETLARVLMVGSAIAARLGRNDRGWRLLGGRGMMRASIWVYEGEMVWISDRWLR